MKKFGKFCFCDETTKQIENNISRVPKQTKMTGVPRIEVFLYINEEIKLTYGLVNTY